MTGNDMHDLAKRLWPINRSLTGEGVRETLQILQELVQELQIKEVPSGTRVFDWEVPREWRPVKAYIITPNGEKICDFSKNNLHLVGYSIPIKAQMTLDELDEHLYSLPQQPEAIPYITSYYKDRWGFCLTQKQRDSLQSGIYEVVIESELFEGNLTYGEIFFKGKSDKEVFLSTYVCHPSMANNELSGPVVTTYLAQWLSELKDRKYSYRIVFIPETIGSITYISLRKDHLKKHVIAGFNISCIGDDRAYSYLPSRRGDSLSDLVAQHTLSILAPGFKSYEWKHRGSDERQYCAPGIDLPIASIMRTKYGEYPEYHTSLDDLEHVVTPRGLDGGYRAFKKAIETIESHCYPRVKTLCEPQLGKRGLYPTLSTKETGKKVQVMMDLITWSDGTLSLLDIANRCKVGAWELSAILQELVEHDLIELFDAPSPFIEN
jgi:aminopeptidase-like protein